MKARWILAILVFTAGALGSLFTDPLLGFLLAKTGPGQWNLYLKTSPESDLLAQKTRILAAGDEVQKVSFFNLGSRGESNAAHVLDPLLFDGVELPLPFSKSQRESLLGSKWTQQPQPEASTAEAFSWLEHLRSFDSWSSQVAPHLLRPSKNFSDSLLILSRARLLTCQQTDCIKTALEDVRHLARLMFTTDEEAFLPVVFALLETESDFLKQLPSGQLANLDWKPIPDKALEAAKSFFAWLPWTVDPRIGNETFLLFFNHPSGRCLLSRMAIKRHLLLLLTSKRESFTEPLRRITQISRLSESSCHPDPLRGLWKGDRMASPEENLQGLLLANSEKSWTSWLTRRLGENLLEKPQWLEALCLHLLNQNRLHAEAEPLTSS